MEGSSLLAKQMDGGCTRYIAILLHCSEGHYFAWQVQVLFGDFFSYEILPADEVSGTQLRNEGKKVYKINGTTLSSKH